MSRGTKRNNDFTDDSNNLSQPPQKKNRVEYNSAYSQEEIRQFNASNFIYGVEEQQSEPGTEQEENIFFIGPGSSNETQQASTLLTLDVNDVLASIQQPGNSVQTFLNLDVNEVASILSNSPVSFFNQDSSNLQGTNTSQRRTNQLGTGNNFIGKEIKKLGRI